MKKLFGVFLGIAVGVLTLGCPNPEPNPSEDTTISETGSSPDSLDQNPTPNFLLGGIQVNEADHERWAKSLLNNRFNTVSTTVYAHQGDWDSSNLWFDEEAPYVEQEIHITKEAGLAVVLIPRVAVDHAFPRNRFLWHGMIMPTRDEDVREWFRRYRRFVVQWARVAEREGVDLFAVGSEMSSLTSTLDLPTLPALHEFYLNKAKQEERKARNLGFEGEIAGKHLADRLQEIPYENLESYLDDRIRIERDWAYTVTYQDREDPVSALAQRRRLLEEEWRRLIAEVREVFHGPLTYAANFDQYHEVGFWDALDTMGINAYFPLRQTLHEVDARELSEIQTQGWEEIFEGIADFQEKENLEKPVVFTELGYTRRRGSTLEPWAGDGFSIVGWGDQPSQLVVWSEQPLDEEERASAMRALKTVSDGSSVDLGGILYWKLSTIPSHEDEEPFVLILDREKPDPLLPTLQAFVDS